MTNDYAASARALVGTRFRAQGRGGEGLDCVGVVLATYGIEDRALRADYRMSGPHDAELRSAIERHFRRLPAPQLRSGDLLLLKVSAQQLHLAVKTASGFVHAHAGIRGVVETPGEPAWPIIGAYRRRLRAKAR